MQAGLALVEATPKLNTAAGRSLGCPGRHRHRARRGRRSDRRGRVRRSRRSSARRRTSRRAFRPSPSRTWWSSPRARESCSASCSNWRTSAPRSSRASAGRCGRGRRCGRVPSESRFEALHTTGLTALVGREEEFELLLRRWSRAKAGQGQVVLISGEAGIGKSRLTAALLERLGGEPHTRLRYFCSPQHTDSALYPIIGQMERAAGLAHDDAPQAKLDKLDAVLAQTATSPEDAALLAEMLSLPNDGRYPALELTPQQRRQRTLDALASQLEALDAPSPVLMIFEDAHWTDPTSLEAFGRTVDRIRTLRGPADRDVPARVRRAVARPVACDEPDAQSAWRSAKPPPSSSRVVGNKELPANIRRRSSSAPTASRCSWRR